MRKEAWLMGMSAIFPAGLLIVFLTDPVGILSSVGVGGLLGILLVVSIPFMIAYWGYTSTKKEELQDEKKMKKVGAINMLKCQHIAGVPIPEQTQCILYLCKESIMIEYNNKLYKFNLDTVVDAYVDNFTNVSKHYVSSTGGAITGGILFGAVGAAVGGRVKTKYEVSSKQYLGITRKDSKTYSCILMEVKASNTNKAYEMAKSINAKIKRNIVEI